MSIMDGLTEHASKIATRFVTLRYDACRNIISISKSGSCFSSRNPGVLFTPSMLSNTKSSAISCPENERDAGTKMKLVV